jgi:fatty acid desaturase
VLAIGAAAGEDRVYSAVPTPRANYATLMGVDSTADAQGLTLSSPFESVVARVPPTDDYAHLKRLISEEGLLERQPRRYIASATIHAVAFCVLVAGMVFTRGSWWALAWTVPAAFMFGQLGFMAHEATHNQILKTSRANYVLSLLLFNLSLGASRAWWAQKHNVHHAQPNRLGTDPDIEGGVIATNEPEAVKARGVARLIMRRQGVAIWPLLSLGVLQIHVYSAGFLCNRRLRNGGCEACLLLIHSVAYVAGLILLLGVGKGLLFALIHQMLLGAYLGSVFLTNHLGMPMLQPDDEGDFLNRQILTARNLRANPVSDYVFGALSCQIEHHLFPTMPRFHLRAASRIVRVFCQERGIAYHETGVLEAFGEVHRYLTTVVAKLSPSYARIGAQA